MKKVVWYFYSAHSYNFVYMFKVDILFVIFNSGVWFPDVCPNELPSFESRECLACDPTTIDDTETMRTCAEDCEDDLSPSCRGFSMVAGEFMHVWWI